MLNIIASILVYRAAIPLLKRWTQPIRADGPSRHLYKSVIPTMGGGIFILLTLFASVNLILHPLILALISFGLLGLYDDVIKIYYKNSRGISAKSKFIIQWLLALVLVNALRVDTQVDFILFQYDLGLLYPVFASLMVVACSNAMNLTDGIDGLAATQALGLMVFLGAMSIGIVDEEVTHILLAIASALIGFLFWNRYPAKIFMGDTGSLALGACLAMGAIILKVEIVFGLVAMVMVWETVSVIIQVIYYKRTKKRFFRMAPFHHHLELSGWSENSIVWVCFMITSILVVVFGALYASRLIT